MGQRLAGVLYSWEDVKKRKRKKKDSVGGAATCRIPMWARFEVDDQER